MQGIKLSLIGLTKQDHAILAVAIKLVDVPGVSLEVLPENDASGDIALINGDAEAGLFYLKQESSEQFKIILASQFVSSAGSRFLERPVRIHDVENALSLACQRYIPKITANNEAGSATGSSVQKQSSSSPVFSNNTPLLLHELITACKKNALIKLECSPYSPFYINGISRTVATKATLPEIHIIAKEKETRPSVTTLSASEEFEYASDNSMTVYPVNTVIWHTALVGAEGGILPEHTVDTPVKLKSLPRFPREYMRKHPEYLKMSAMLTRKSMTVRQLQQVTQLEEEAVIDFYNLVFSLGLSVIDESANATELYKKKQSKNSSLLSRLAKKLSATG